jgi:RIO kinase 1
VDVVINPRGLELMTRDVRNISRWFAARELPEAEARGDELLERLSGEAGIGK